jgi:DNA-binding MarR family transcriptional regulator
MQLAQDSDAAISLAKKLAVTAPSASNVVDGLVQRGAIERTHSIDDRRRISLALTDTGRNLLSDADNAVRNKLESLADELNDEALATSVIDSLVVWGEALDRARTRRLVRPGESAAASP